MQPSNYTPHDLWNAHQNVPGWEKLSRSESAGHSDCNLRYWVLAPTNPDGPARGRALFYLHGLGGHPHELADQLQNFAAQGYTVFLVEQPGPKILSALLTCHFKIPLFCHSFTPGTLVKMLWNGHRCIDTLAGWWGFNEVDIISMSYGGLCASFFAAHSTRARRIVAIASSPDILDVVRHAPKLVNHPMVDRIWAIKNIHGKIDALHNGRGAQGAFWQAVSPWRHPANPNAKIHFLANQGDPVMRYESLLHARQLSLEHGLDYLHVHSVANSPSHCPPIDAPEQLTHLCSSILLS